MVKSLISVLTSYKCQIVFHGQTSYNPTWSCQEFMLLVTKGVAGELRVILADIKPMAGKTQRGRMEV